VTFSGLQLSKLVKCLGGTAVHDEDAAEVEENSKARNMRQWKIDCLERRKESDIAVVEIKALEPEGRIKSTLDEFILTFCLTVESSTDD
jgi:hypothetical protein